MFEKTENNRKRGRGWPIFLKKHLVIFSPLSLIGSNPCKGKMVFLTLPNNLRQQVQIPTTAFTFLSIYIVEIDTVFLKREKICSFCATFDRPLSTFYPSLMVTLIALHRPKVVSAKNRFSLKMEWRKKSCLFGVRAREKNVKSKAITLLPRISLGRSNVGSIQ